MNVSKLKKNNNKNNNNNNNNNAYKPSSLRRTTDVPTINITNVEGNKPTFSWIDVCSTIFYKKQ